MSNNNTRKFSAESGSSSKSSDSPTEVSAPDENQSEIAKLSRQMDEQTRYFEAILSSISDFAYTFDKDGRFVFVNRALLDLWGLKLEEAIGKNFFDLKYPDDLAAHLQHQIQQVFETKQRVTDETPYTSPTGVVGYYEYIFSPFFDANGAVELVVGTTRNITRRKQTEDEVKILSERNLEILESITDGFFALDQNWRFTYVNRQAGQILDKIPGEMIGKSIWDVYPGLVGSEFERVYHRVAKNGVAETLISFYPDHDRFYEVNAYPAPNGITIYFRDATESKLVEKALRESEEHLRHTVELNPQIPWTASPDGAIESFSESWLDLTGLTTEESIGEGWINAPHADDLPLMQAAWTNSVKTGVPYDIEHRVRVNDNSFRWMRSRAFPRRNEAGEIVRWYGTTEDIHERKIAEENLRHNQAETDRQRRLYDTILSNTPDLIYVFDLDHRFAYANDVLLKVWGKTFDEAIGKTFLELGYEPWHAEMHDREIEQVIATKQPIRGEVPFSGTFGRRMYDYIFVPIFGADGEVEAIGGTTRDITESQQMEDALREADRRKDEFLATLAHELRNPLAPIRSGLEIIRRVKNDPVKFDKTLDIIERQTNQIVHLVEDLLDISRITQGKIRLRKERVELKAAIEMALETSQQIIDEAENELTVTLPSKPIYIDADLTRIAQIFLNILNNAAKYSDPGGKISLSADKEGDNAVVRIKDTGIGIMPEMLSKIFDMFGQVETPYAQLRGGLGIGLSVVKKLVEMHGGTVQALSDGRGKGSEFIVELPLAEEQSATTPPKSAATPKQVTSNTENADSISNAAKLKVLVVDDNTDAVEMIETLLGFDGYAVRKAFEGKTAVAIATEFKPDVCLLDIGLPGMNGFELAARLREFLPDALLISVSGWGQEEDRRRSREAGFDYHFVKPVEFDNIQKLLTEASNKPTS